MPSAPAGAAEAATGGDLDGHRRGGGAAPPPQTAEEAVATARAYAESISDGVIERDRAGNAPVAELARLDASGLLAITVPRSLGGPELGAPALAEVIRTIAAVDPAIAQVPQGTSCSAMCSRSGAPPGSSGRCSARCSPGRGSATGWPSAAGCTPRTSGRGCTAFPTAAGPGPA